MKHNRKYWERQTTEDIQHQITASQGSMDIRNPRSRTSIFVQMLQCILGARGANQVGANGCTGGSKVRIKRGE